MKNLARFAEYSLTGGLLWINILIFATLIFYHAVPGMSPIENIFHLWQEWVEVANKSFSTLDSGSTFSRFLSTILSTLSIILIFCSGLLLNIISPLFCAPFEMFIFKRKLVSRNNSWLDNIISQYSDFMHDDYTTFKNESFFNFKDPKHSRRQQARYVRIYLFLSSYLYTNANSSQLELVSENIRIWRISRALSTSLIVMSLLLNFLLIAGSSLAEEHFGVIMLSIVVPLLLFMLSIIITTTMFSRLIDNVFSQTYLMHKKLAHESQ